MSFIEIRDLTVSYKNSEPCIKSMDLSIEKGEILVILGPSGCGKSTLLKTISGLLHQDSGSILVDGTDISNMSPEKRPVSMVFQKALLFRNMTVGQNVNYAPRVNGTMKKEEMAERTEKLLELVELKGYADKKSSQLSGGQEQRVSLARALMTEPKVLLLDEPLSALDTSLRVSLRESIRNVCKQLNQTVIFVTHDQQEAIAVGDKVALMMNGRIKQISEPNDYYHRPCCKRTAMFFGWKNAISAVQDGKNIHCRLGDYVLDHLEEKHGEVVLLIHPQAAMCNMLGEFSGIVREASFLGTTSIYKVDINGELLEIQVSCRNMRLVGETISFDLDRAMMWTVDVEPEEVPEKETAKKKSLFERIFKR